MLDKAPLLVIRYWPGGLTTQSGTGGNAWK